MGATSHKTLVLACGALAKEILVLQKQVGADFDLQCLPASYHNFPNKIVPGLEKELAGIYDNYDEILIGYGDCGTGGGMDRFLKRYPKARRLPGAHCYAFFAGLENFDAMMEEELGSFFLTDYLVRHFQTLIVKGFGIDRYPNLKEMYFEHYKRLIYLVQDPELGLTLQAREVADFLELEYEERQVGYGLMAGAIDSVEKGEGLTHVL
ncbi:MAG: DUF1638 domain-containing protein [Hellea sp.]|nr:DUF1638 domain-containing protein [Hellea sp.]